MGHWVWQGIERRLKISVQIFKKKWNSKIFPQTLDLNVEDGSSCEIDKELKEDWKLCVAGFSQHSFLSSPSSPPIFP